MTQEVEAYLADLQHPRKPEILLLREIILGVDDRIGESIKWNAPSFHTTEHFATMHLRARDGIQVVLHLGVKSRPDTTVRSDVADPAKLLEWRGADRATVTFRDVADIEARRAPFVKVLRQWLKFV